MSKTISKPRVRLKTHRGKIVMAWRDPAKGLRAAPFSMKRAARLKQQGYRIDSLADAYHYPGPYKQPRDCQKAMVRTGLRYKRFFNLSEMRTGKTNGTLWMLDIRMRYMGLKRVLLVAPLNTVSGTWQKDISASIPHVATYYAYKTVTELKEALLSNKYSIIVMNPGKLMKARREIMRWNPEFVVVDEMMEFKNPDTTQYQALESIMASEEGLKRGFVPLSGTLGSQCPTDVWTSARFINPKTPRDFGAFKKKVLFRPKGEFNKYVREVRDDAEQYVASLLSPSVRFRTDDVNDMPRHEGFSMRVEMSSHQKRMFNEIRKQDISKHDDKVVTVSHAAVRLWKLLQICAGVVYSEDQQPVVCGAPEKIMACRQLIRETPRKTVIFAGWTCQQEYIKQQLGKEFKVDILNGKVPPGKQRDAKELAFQEGDTQVLVCHPRITKHGTKLDAGSLVIWFGPRTSTEEFVQGSARVRGQGTGATGWCELSCSALEERWFNIVKNRDRRKSRILDLYREVQKGLI